MKRFVKRLLCLTMASMMLAMPAMAQGKISGLWVSQAEDLGIPLTNTQFINCTFSQEDGKNMMYSTATGQPAVLVCYNLDDRRVERELPLEGAKVSWSHGTDADGRVYIATQSEASLFRYDPKIKELKNFGKVYDKNGKEQTAFYDVSFDGDGNPYMGTYPSALLVRYNLKEEKFEIVSDQLFPGESYVRAQLIHENGFLYAGGIADKASLVRMDMETKKVEKLPYFVLPDGDGAATFNSISAAGDYLFCHVTTNKKKPITAIFQLSTNKWLDGEGQVMESYGYYQSPPIDGKVYVNNMAQKQLYAFDLETAVYEETGITGMINRYSEVFEFQDAGLPGKTMCTIQANGKVSYTNFENKTYEEIPIDAGQQPIEVRSLEKGKVGTNTVALGAYMGSKMGVMDSVSGRVRSMSMQQVEGMGEVNGQFYTCTYPGGNVWAVDFDKMTSKKLFSMAEQEQDRPFQIIDANGIAAISSVPDYGQLGGALTLYDPATGKEDTYRNVVKDQSVIGLAYRDGKIYGSTAVWGGLGIQPSTEEANVFVFDIAARKVEQVKPLRLSSIQPVMYAGELSFSESGELWGASKGVLFRLNPETLETEQEIAVDPQAFSKDQPFYSPYSIEWLSPEVFVTNAGGVLAAVDIKSGEFQKLWNDPIRFMTVSEDGYLYFTSENRTKLFKMAVSLNGDTELYLQSKLPLEHAAVLCLDSPKAYVNRFRTVIDQQSGLSPYTVSDRTMVPLRFLAESFGAEVSWDDGTSTATVELDGTSVILKSDAAEMNVNGKAVAIDVPAQLKNDRIMLPLRAVAEALHKHVYWEESGLIFLSEETIEQDDTFYQEAKAIKGYFELFDD